MGITEHQWKELSKYFLDNGNRKLSTEEKERIKLAIDQANNLNELLQGEFKKIYMMIFEIKIIYFKTIVHKRNIFLVRYFFMQRNYAITRHISECKQIFGMLLKAKFFQKLLK